MAKSKATKFTIVYSDGFAIKNLSKTEAIKTMAELLKSYSIVTIKKQ